MPRSKKIQEIKNNWTEFFILKKLDGVGPVDNRLSIDKLDPFVQKKRKKSDM